MADGSGTRARQWLRKLEGSRTRTRPPACSVKAAAATDVGRVRRNNEDTFQYDEASGIYIVCDGMGGMAAGEVASGIAAETALATFARLRSNPATVPSVQDALGIAIADANAEVLAAADEPGRSGMGTTLVAAAVENDHLVVANVGDSRAYLVHDGTVRQVTRDHSYANEVQRIAGIAPEDVPAGDLLRYGSLITRAVGAADRIEPEFFPVPFQLGDMLLLATDGLTRYFEEPAGLLLLLDPDDLQGSCEALIAAANAAGGVDNVTVLLLRCVAGSADL